MFGIRHGWQTNESDMCWTIHRSQSVITTFLSDPRSTFIFSHWSSLLSLFAYAVERKKNTQLFIDNLFFFTLWCACYLAFRSETWSDYSVCVDILWVEHVKNNENFFFFFLYHTDALLRMTIKRHSSQALPCQFQPWQKTVFVIYCNYGVLYNSLTSYLSLVYFLLSKKEIWKYHKRVLTGR